MLLAVDLQVEFRPILNWHGVFNRHWKSFGMCGKQWHQVCGGGGGGFPGLPLVCVCDLVYLLASKLYAHAELPKIKH
jgi:hypothetical protein